MLCKIRSNASSTYHLVLDVCGRTEDVRVVLLEAAHAREAGERSAQLVAV